MAAVRYVELGAIPGTRNSGDTPKRKFTRSNLFYVRGAREFC
jgi:hypothetical protein